jgi:pilus assembly protein CpaE
MNLAANITPKPDRLVTTNAKEGVLLAAIVDDTTREIARLVARQLGWLNSEICQGGPDVVLSYIIAHAPPSFLLVDVSECADPISELEAVGELCDAGTTVIALGLINDISLYRRFIEIGVADYLVKPISGENLAEAICKATMPETPRAEASGVARTIAMIGSRGGVGVTTLAVSIAWTLSQQLRVVALDLDLHFGNLALSLDLDAKRGFLNLLSHPDRIDSLLVDAAANPFSDRLRILASEESLEATPDLGGQSLSTLLTDLRTGSEFIVVDTPRALTTLSREILEEADVVGIVTDRSLAGMRDTRRLLTLIRSARADAQVLVVANKVGGVAGEIDRGDFERGVGAKIDFSIPFDAKAAQATAERARPFVEVAKAPKVLTELRLLAVQLAGVGGHAEPKKPLVRRLMGQ